VRITREWLVTLGFRAAVFEPAYWDRYSIPMDGDCYLSLDLRKEMRGKGGAGGTDVWYVLFETPRDTVIPWPTMRPLEDQQDLLSLMTSLGWKVAH
jgi:hypothetical protein